MGTAKGACATSLLIKWLWKHLSLSYSFYRSLHSPRPSAFLPNFAIIRLKTAYRVMLYNVCCRTGQGISGVALQTVWIASIRAISKLSGIFPATLLLYAIISFIRDSMIRKGIFGSVLRTVLSATGYPKKNFRPFIYRISRTGFLKKSSTRSRKTNWEKSGYRFMEAVFSATILRTARSNITVTTSTMKRVLFPIWPPRFWSTTPEIYG